MKNWSVSQWVGFAWDVLLGLALITVIVLTFGSLSNWEWVLDFENVLEDVFAVRYFRFYDLDVNWGVWMVFGTGVALAMSLIVQYDRAHFKR